MSHNYRQARRNGWLDGDGYHISLETILAERGLVKEKRLRDNVDSVRASLADMKKEKSFVNGSRMMKSSPWPQAGAVGRLSARCGRSIPPTNS